MKIAATLVLASLTVASAEVFTFLEDNYDFQGPNVAVVKADAWDKCSGLCPNTTTCDAFSWSDYSGGTCWFKNHPEGVVYNLGVKSSVLSPTPIEVCKLVDDVDIVGNDLVDFPAASADLCCDMCHKTAKCRAYSWNDWNKGTCWLKTGRGRVIAKPGVKSADAYPNSAPWLVLTPDTDFVGQDLDNKPGKKAEDCFALCKGKPGCRAFAWSDQSGGTCYLKTKKDNVVAKPGVFSAVVAPQSACTYKNGTDYYDNNFGNVPKVADLTDCCNICADTKHCKAFTWNDWNGGTCWLKSEIGVEQPTPDVTAGVVVVTV